MKLFNKDETLLEKYYKELKSKKNPTIDIEVNLEDIIEYLEETISSKSNPFSSDQILIDVLNNYIKDEDLREYTIKTSTLKLYLKEVLKIYHDIVSTNIERDKQNEETLRTILNRIIEKQDGKSILELDMFNSLFFNLFKNKNNYFQVMEIFEKDNALQNKKEFDKFITYAFNNREYFNQEEIFTANLKKILKMYIVTPEEDFYELYTEENKKRIGIYEIDENLIEELDDIITNSDSVLQELQREKKLSEKTILSLKKELNTAIDKLKTSTKTEENNIKKEAKDLLEQFKLDLRNAIQEETDKFRKDTDTILNSVNDKVEEKINNVKIITNQIDEETRKELQRIRKTGNETVEKLRKAIGENPDIEKVLETYLPVNELIEKLQETQTMIQNVPTIVTNPQKVVSIPTIITPKEIPQDINHFFDPRISFTSRFNELKEKMKKKEEEGEIYHKKFPDLLKMIMEDCNPYLWGNSGLGKTYMIKQAFELLEQEYRPINKILEDYDIIGVTLPNGEYSNPLWYQCYKYGYGAFLDELDSSNSEATIVINSFTSNKEGSFYPFPSGEVVYRHPNFRIVAAGNTAGTGADIYFNDRKQLDESVQQRLMPLELTPDSRIEEKILKNYPDWFEFTQNFRKATDNYAKERKLKAAPGELTTRDTEQIKQLKDNKVFTDEEIIEYEIIENKSDDYLGYLVDEMQKYYQGGRQKSKKLYNSFQKRVNEIRGE